MMIAPNSRARKGGKGRGEYGRILVEGGNADYGGMVQPSQHHVAPCVEEVERGLGPKGLEMVAACWYPGRGYT